MRRSASRHARPLSAHTPANAFAGDEIKAKTAAVLVLLVACAGNILIISAAKTHTAPCSALIFLIWPDGVKNLFGGVSLNRERDLLVVGRRSDRVSKSPTVYPLRCGRFFVWLRVLGGQGHRECKQKEHWK